MPNACLSSAKSFVILLADDDPGDQELTRRALEVESLHIDLRVVSNGEEALDYLEQRDAYQSPTLAPRPDLMLLDLNMPRMNGREVLSVVKRSPTLCHIPVVILTTSQQEADIIAAYNLGCNSYVQKPVEIERFLRVVRELRSYWFDIVSLPVHASFGNGQRTH